MDRLSAIMGQVADALGATPAVLGVWAATGFVVSLVLIGRRPFGLGGDIILAVAGAIAGGWAAARWLPLPLAEQIRGMAPTLPEGVENLAAAAVEAFVGALILPVLARFAKRS